MLEVAAVLTVLVVCSVSVWLLGLAQAPGFEWAGSAYGKFIPIPLLLACLLVAIFYESRSRFYLTRRIFRIITAPFHRVTFSDFFIADQLVSLSIVLYDFEYSVCYYVSDAWAEGGGMQCLAANQWTRPVISVLPSLWRFLQCLRRFRDHNDRWQLVNAMKYLTGITVGTTSALRVPFADDVLALWLLACVCSALFGTYWDIRKDWSVDRTMLPSKCCQPSSGGGGGALEEGGDDGEKVMASRKETQLRTAEAAATTADASITSSVNSLFASKAKSAVSGLQTTDQSSPSPSSPATASVTGDRAQPPTKPRHYPNLWYFIAAITDAILRWLWTLTISPSSLGDKMQREWFISGLALLEIYRRGMWNVFRLENEHSNNVGRFRAVGHIPVIDLETSDRPEDEDEGDGQRSPRESRMGHKNA